ncbi:MAG: hypothetical protein V4747_07495 [Pseudomonadota bacterium]
MNIAAKWLTVGLIALCGCVREEDTKSWEGQPVSSLDLHPFFATLPVEVRKAADGTEMRNYVNGVNVGSCFSNATVTASGAYAAFGTGSTFCSTQFRACNNIFYVRSGKVIKYTPTPSGGAICMTDQRVRPVAGL